MTYNGPDAQFGQHDDYAQGDTVHTYDNEQAVVTAVEPDAYGSAGTKYEVLTESGRTRHYDGSRLALVRRHESVQ